MGMGYSVQERDSCRVCGSRQVHGFLTVHDLPLAEGHVRPEDVAEVYTADLPLHWCRQCGVVQVLQDMDFDAYYEDYVYTVSHSPLMQTFMTEFATSVWRRFGLRPGDNVIEIGSSDGWQLKRFQDLGAHVLGFEPSAQLTAASRAIGVQTEQCLFTAETLDRIPPEFRPVHAVVSQYTFDHLPDPVDFLRTVAQVLDPERGVVVNEVHDFEKLYERREACLFSHEHFTYCTSESMARVFEAAGMRLLSTSLVPEAQRRGNSLIAAAALAGAVFEADPAPITPTLLALRAQPAYDDFGQEIERSHRRLADHVRAMNAAGRRVAGYGAAARGVTTMVVARLGVADVPCFFDLNPHLQGRLMPGSLIPVVAPERIAAWDVDEVIVFSYGYLQEIREQLADFIAAGGQVTSVLDYLQPEPAGAGSSLALGLKGRGGPISREQTS